MALPSVSRFAAAVALTGLLIAVTSLRAAEDGPKWSDIAPAQQQVLAPLKDDWVNIEGPRRVKWVEIAKRFSSMTPEQQTRIQTRMKQWASMSAEERAQVRERYKKLKEMPPEKRDEVVRKWREYESLTDDEKDSLRAAHPAKPAKP